MPRKLLNTLIGPVFASLLRKHKLWGEYGTSFLKIYFSNLFFTFCIHVIGLHMG